MKTNNILLILIFIAGLACLALGVYSYTKSNTSVAEAPSSTGTSTRPQESGTVIQLDPKSSSWYPVGKGTFLLEASGTIVIGSVTYPNGREEAVIVSPDGWKQGDETAKVPELQFGALIAKIGEDGKPFKMGTSYNFASGEKVVYIAINDSDYTDNTGAFTVTVMKKSAPGSSKRLQVPADVEWFDTGIDITGKKVRIEYISGEWTNGGDEPLYASAAGAPHSWEGLLLANAPIRALIGKTNSGMFMVGSRKEGELGIGRLYLSINDIPGKFNDNKGSLLVNVSFLE